jgi:hypothetical protein
MYEYSDASLGNIASTAVKVIFCNPIAEGRYMATSKTDSGVACVEMLLNLI